jgi:hypothetical protein
MSRAQMSVLGWILNDSELYGEGDNREFAVHAENFEETLRRLEKQFGREKHDDSKTI